MDAIDHMLICVWDGVTDVENKHGYQEGGRGGINWETRLTYTYYCLD